MPSLLSRTGTALVVALILPVVVISHHAARANAVGQACDGRPPQGPGRADTEPQRRAAEPARRRDEPQGQACPRRPQAPGSR